MLFFFCLTLGRLPFRLILLALANSIAGAAIWPVAVSLRAAEASSVERGPQFLRLSSGIREKDDTPRRNGAGQLRLSTSGAGALGNSGGGWQ